MGAEGPGINFQNHFAFSVCSFHELWGAPGPQESYCSLQPSLPSTLSRPQQITTANSPGRGFYILKKKKSFYWGKK